MANTSWSPPSLCVLLVSAARPRRGRKSRDDACHRDREAKRVANASLRGASDQRRSASSTCFGLRTVPDSPYVAKAHLCVVAPTLQHVPIELVFFAFWPVSWEVYMEIPTDR